MDEKENKRFRKNEKVKDGQTEKENPKSEI